jgi:hypothetical protein
MPSGRRSVSRFQQRARARRCGSTLTAQPDGGRSEAFPRSWVSLSLRSRKRVQMWDAKVPRRGAKGIPSSAQERHSAHMKADACRRANAGPALAWIRPRGEVSCCRIRRPRLLRIRDSSCWRAGSHTAPFSLSSSDPRPEDGGDGLVIGGARLGRTRRRARLPGHGRAGGVSSESARRAFSSSVPRWTASG